MGMSFRQVRGPQGANSTISVSNRSPGAGAEAGRVAGDKARRRDQPLDQPEGWHRPLPVLDHDPGAAGMEEMAGDGLA